MRTPSLLSLTRSRRQTSPRRQLCEVRLCLFHCLMPPRSGGILLFSAAKRRHVKHVKTTCSYPKEPKSSDFASKSWSQCGLHDFGYPSSFAKISADSESSGHRRSKSIKNSFQLDPYLSGHVHLGRLKQVGPITKLCHIYGVKPAKSSFGRSRNPS